MNYLSIDYLIVYAFLGITMIAGVGGLRMKAVSGNFKEYVTAGKRFGTGALIMTMLATYIGGGILFTTPSDVYNSGLAGIVGALLNIGIPISLVIYFIAPKIVHFKDCMTTGDLMHIFYGENVRIITGVMAFVTCSSLCAYQFMWLKYLGVQLGINSSWGMVLGVGILTLYTIRGGMRAVTVTDILHFVVALAIIPLLAHLLLHRAGGFRVILSALSPEKLHFLSPEALADRNGTKTITAGIISVLFPGFALSFPFIQRMLMAKHQQQSVIMYRAGLAIFLPFLLVLSFIGLAAIVIYPESNSQLLLLRITEQLPPVSKGLVWITLIGIIISTADSFLHTASIVFVHDTLKPLADRWGIKFDELRVVRYATLLVSLAGLVICLVSDQLSSFFFYALRLSSLPIAIPLMAGIMGLKTDKKAFYASTIIAISVHLLPMIFLQGDLVGDLSGAGSIVASLFSYLGVHYYFNRGFEVVNRSQYGQTTSVWHPSWQGAGKTLTGLIPTPQKLVRYFQQRIAENSSNTTTLALFIAVSYMVPLFMYSIGQPEAYEWLLVLRMIGALLCVGLLLQSQWPDALLRYFSTYYHLALLFCFPFMTTFLFLLEGGSIEWVMNVMLSVMLLIMLLDYMTAAGISIAGIALAMGVYKLGIGPLALSMDIDTAYMLVYGVGFSIVIGVLFSRLRERFLRQANRRLLNQEAALEAHFPAVMAETERRTRAFQQIGIKGLLHTARKLHTIQHKTVAAQEEQQALFTSLAQRQQAFQAELLALSQQQQAPSAELLAQQQALQAEFDSLTQQQAPKKELTTIGQHEAPQEELHVLAQHHLAPQAELNSLSQQQQDLQADLLPLVMQLQDLDTRGKDHLSLDVKKALPLDEFLLSLQEKLLPRGIDVPLLIERKTKQQKITGDTNQLVALLVKSIAALQWLIHDQDQYLLLGIEDTQLIYPLPDVAEGYVKQVPALRITLTATEALPPLAASYRPDLANFVPTTHQTFQEMEQQADERLIKAHYGYTAVSEDTLTYVIPVDVYEVRPQDMDKPELAIGVIPERADDHFKHDTADAQAQEEAFLKVVAARSTANLGVIKLALNLIKWYHGHKNRHTKEPFYLHPLAVAQIVLDYNQEEATIVGALLHDTVEDTPMLMAHIETLFGKETASVVDLVTHLQSMEGSMYKVKLSAEENLKMLGNTENKRGLYVKMADRMHNMRTINGHPKVSKRKLVAQETADFFVPLAKELGLDEAAAEFEKMCTAVFKQQD